MHSGKGAGDNIQASRGAAQNLATNSAWYMALSAARMTEARITLSAASMRGRSMSSTRES
jgi:hypothetical protein